MERRRRFWSVVDASVWVSRFVVADTHHVASTEWLHVFLSRGHRIVVPTLLLVEVAGAIARRTGDNQRTVQIVELLRRLPGLRWIGLNGDVRDHAADLALTLRLRGADAVYVTLADRLRIPLITWDAEQVTRVRPPIQVDTPLTARA